MQIIARILKLCLFFYNPLRCEGKAHASTFVYAKNTDDQYSCADNVCPTATCCQTSKL